MVQFAYTTYDDTIIHYRMESFFPFKRSYVNVSFILIKTQATVLFKNKLFFPRSSFTVDLKWIINRNLRWTLTHSVRTFALT